MRCVVVMCFAAWVSSCLPESFSIGDGGLIDAGVDAPEGDVSEAVDAVTVDALVLDAAPPDTPPDAAPSNNINVACPTHWTELAADPDGSCAGRRIGMVGRALGPFAIDIALLESQEVALAWNANDFIDSGGMELRVLNADTLAITRSASVEPEAMIGEVAGTSISLVPEGDDVHLAYWLRSDAGSTIEYRRWSAEFLSPAETISAQVDRSGTVDLSVSDRGDATFVFHDLALGRHFSRTRRRNGDLETTVNLGEDRALVPADSPGVSLAHENGISHLAFRQRHDDERAAPRYRRRVDGGEWSTSTVIDDPPISRYGGIAIDIAVSGDNVAVAYLDWTGGRTEVRLATWNTTPDEIVVQVLATTTLWRHLFIRRWTSSMTTSVSCISSSPMTPGAERSNTGVSRRAELAGYAIRSSN